MTIESKIIFELKDIERIRLRCAIRDCDGEATVKVRGLQLRVRNSRATSEPPQQPQKFMYMPSRCPSCGEEWRPGDKTNEIDGFLSVVQRLHNAPGLPVQISLEMPVPPS